MVAVWQEQQDRTQQRLAHIFSEEIEGVNRFMSDHICDHHTSYKFRYYWVLRGFKAVRIEMEGFESLPKKPE